MAGRRQKKSGGRSYAWRYRGRIVACVFVEVIIICALVIMIGWNKGVKEWFEQFEQPVLKEVDISGINSPNAILMQARGVIQSMGALGPAKAAMLIVISQLAVAYVIELFGLFGVDKEPFEWRKILGLLIAISGIVIFKWQK